MPPSMTCDPSPNQFRFKVISKDAGRVTVTCRYTWDGVSTPSAGCNGPIEDVRVQNTGPNVWIVSLPNSRTQKTQELPPGTDRTFSGQQLQGIGLVMAADMDGLQLVPAS